MSIITFSGWAQDYDALEVVAPGARHINYRDFENSDELFESLGVLECDVLIGWSLGGQLALRAVDLGVIVPKTIVLLAVPFQFMKNSELKFGIDVNNFNTLVSDFVKDHKNFLSQFGLAVAHNDNKYKDILRELKKNCSDNLSNWLYWLEELGEFSCCEIDFQKMPKTIIIHGDGDKVVDVDNVTLFRPFLSDLRIETLCECGHAPHLHDTDFVSKIIKEAA